MLSIRAVANELLGYIGVSNLDPNANLNELLQRGIGETDIADSVNCINGAFQEMYTVAPAAEIKRRVGGILRPPTSITISVTQYATACAITGFATWMLGCTVRISGHDIDNQILSSTLLMRPFAGTTGSTTATVYADCLAVPSTYAAVIEPVEIPSRPWLEIVKTWDEFRYWNCQERRTRMPESYGSYQLQNKTIGEPLIVLAEFEALGTAANSLYLRFNPMPGQLYDVLYTAKLAPPVVTAEDIWSEDAPTVDPAVPIYIPNAEATLLPIALQRWTRNRHFSADGAQRQEIGRQYQQALTILRTRQPMFATTSARYVG